MVSAGIILRESHKCIHCLKEIIREKQFNQFVNFTSIFLLRHQLNFHCIFMILGALFPSEMRNQPKSSFCMCLKPKNRPVHYNVDLHFLIPRTDGEGNKHHVGIIREQCLSYDKHRLYHFNRSEEDRVLPLI